MTTSQTITPLQIRQLRTEAADHGDDAQVGLCDVALGTWEAYEGMPQPYEIAGRRTQEEALEICALAIADAEAQS